MSYLSKEIQQLDITIYFREIFESDVWHRDKNDRIVLVLSPFWNFQFDNCLPQKLEEGDIVKIPKGIFHRAYTESAHSLKLIIVELL